MVHACCATQANKCADVGREEKQLGFFMRLGKTNLDFV